MTHLKLDELYTLLELQNPYTHAMPLSGVATDCQEDVMGKIFVAFAEENIDALIKEAEDKGAACALVQKGYKNPYVTIPLLEVGCPEEALLQIAKEKISKTSAQVIAITGSCGNSTVKEFLHTLLASKHKVAKTPSGMHAQKEFAKFVINSVSVDDAYILCDMKLSKSGSISKLCQVLCPDVAVICSLVYAHDLHFETISDIADEVCEIFSQGTCKASIINYDASELPMLLEKATGKKTTYSIQSLQADVKLQIEDSRLVFVERGKKTTFPYLYFPAEHLYSNFLAALLVAKEVGMTYEEVQQAVSSIKVPTGRMQIIQKENITFIDDAHSASEVSTKAALLAMQKKYCKSKKIAVVGAVFGDAVDHGKILESAYINIGKLALSCVDTLFCFGKECAPIVQLWQDEGREVFWHEEMEALIAELQKVCQEGDLVLLKAPRSMVFSRIYEAF